MRCKSIMKSGILRDLARDSIDAILCGTQRNLACRKVVLARLDKLIGIADLPIQAAPVPELTKAEGEDITENLATY